jgi:hypothetical protein
MMIRSFAAGLGFSVLISLQAGCASSTPTPQAPQTRVAADMKAPDIAPPAEEGDGFVYAPGGEKANTMTKDRSDVSTVLHPKVAAKKNHFHDADSSDQGGDSTQK